MKTFTVTKFYLPNGKSLHSFCRETGISYNSCKFCMNAYGYSPEKAYEYIAHEKDRTSQFIKATGETVMQFCNRIGINAVGFYYYTKKKGWTKEETYKHLVKKYLGKEN